MDGIKRVLQDRFVQAMFKGKALVLTGARQVGKSTLFKQILETRSEPSLFLNCDEPEVRALLQDASIADLQNLIAGNQILVIDEAQRIAGIGLVLKRIVDNFPDVQLMVTGSSSLDIHNAMEEPLTGRKFEYNLFPFSTPELVAARGLLSAKQTLENRLIYGSYPDVINHPENAAEILMNLTSSYLYKDLLQDENIRKPVLLEKLLVALALQTGSEVSYNEVAKTVGTDPKTVEKYIDLLEKCFVVFRLGALSRNVRSELKKSKKIFFYDNGVRNAVIQNFAPLSLRADKGALWENFFISERIKRNKYTGRYAKIYFWRTVDQQEIDYVEESDGTFRIFELKANPDKKAKTKFPALFLRNYEVSESAVVTPENYLEFV